ncbi:hypothetical protein [Rhodoferax sp. BLA1]|nr:hypothetical protein [Rhodoferax sp. BLA1]
MIRVVQAVALVTSVMHQPLPVVKALTLSELFAWAQVSAVMAGKEF